MIDYIRQYYSALQSKNIKQLTPVINETIYGVRTYNEQRLFTNDELLKYVKENDIKTYEILSYNTLNNATTLELTINKKPVLAKITTQNGKIYKVYEINKTNKRRIKCVCAYDGSSYSGYQKQVNASSIQETIETTLKNIFKVETPIQSSGRTDKGVHALHQVFHFDISSSIEVPNIKKVLNSYLPDAIHILSTEEVHPTFHSRYDVIEKTYEYKINVSQYNPIQRNYEWFVPHLNVDKCNKDLEAIIGTHDFQSFTKTTPKSTIRTITEAFVTKEDKYLYITITGTGFLRYMVRNIVGALVSINQENLQYSMKEILEARDVTLLKDKAPACGLYLRRVTY